MRILPPDAPLNGKPDVAGGIPLDALMLKEKVADLLRECVQAPKQETPEVREVMTVALNPGRTMRSWDSKSDASVKEVFQNTYWGIVRQLRSLGIDAGAGDFKCEFVLAGSKQEDGQPVVQFSLSWKQRAAAVAP